MKGAVIKPVAQFAEVVTGGTPSTTKPEYWDGDVPWLNSGSLNEGVITTPSKYITQLGLDNSSAKLMPKDTVLVALTGATTGQVGYLAIEASANQSVTGILPSKEHYPKYLYFFLKSQRKKILGDAFGGAQPHINQKYIKDFKIPLPPLDDQIRIAHLLGKVEGLIAQRKHHLQQLDDLLKSVFLEMFGDPVRNEKGWDIHPCEKVVLDISSGTSYGGEDRAFASPDEVGVLKISAVTKGTFDPTEFKVVNPAQITKTLRFVKRGDFLFSRANTVELVAACCIVPQDYNQLFLPDKLWVMTLNPELINPQYFNFLLKNKRYRDVVRNLASGGHDSMLNISMKKFMTFNVPCPPGEIQHQFAAIVERVEDLQSRYQQSLTDLEALYGALSQQAFKDELHLSRVPLPEAGKGSDNTEGMNHEKHEMEVTTGVSVDMDAQILGNRAALITQWLEAYRGQLGSTPFSVQNFMAGAQTRLTELLPDNDFTLNATDYEHIKMWAFKALADGRLQQVRNITGHDDHGKPVFGNLIELKAVQP